MKDVDKRNEKAQVCLFALTLYTVLQTVILFNLYLSQKSHTDNTNVFFTMASNNNKLQLNNIEQGIQNMSHNGISQKYDFEITNETII